jgi:hypothetical protein
MVINGGNVGKRWGTVRDGERRWWTECHHGSRWLENGNATVMVTGQNHDFFCNKSLE